LLNRSYDGGFTWQKTGLVQISTFQGNGTTSESNGKFADHENLHVDPTNGYVYVTWAEFSGAQGTHSPVYVAVSHDQGSTWTISKLTAGRCFNISGGAFRAGGSYPAPAFDTHATASTSSPPTSAASTRRCTSTR
jgi:hypothetical protein